MEKISKTQLSSLIIMFQIGSSPLFLLGKEAGKDAWIAILVAMAVGLLLLIVNLLIHRLEPDKELIQIMNTYFGKYIGYLLGILYFIYFSYKSVRNAREFGDLIGLYLLPTTPLWVLVGSILLIAAYAVWKGLEVVSRIVQIILPFVAFMYLVLFFLIFSTGLFDLHRIEPIWSNGFKKVIDVAIPEIISFPFGEMVVFLMFWTYVTPITQVLRASIRWYVITGLFIALTNFIILSCLGPIAQMSVAPFIQMASLIRYKSFIERLDPIATLLLFTGVFIKITIYFLAATLVGKRLIKVDQKYIIAVIWILIFTGAFLFHSYMHQVWVGFKYNIKYFFPVMQIYLPLFILLVMLVRSRLREKRNRKSQS